MTREMFPRKIFFNIYICDHSSTCLTPISVLSAKDLVANDAKHSVMSTIPTKWIAAEFSYKFPEVSSHVSRDFLPAPGFH
jgi:hypothetical protein